MAMTLLGVRADVKVVSFGISHYPTDSEWCELNAQNDQNLLRETFPGAVTLLDKGATYRGIKLELSSLGGRTLPGDTLIIHFSGHGQQILTQNSKMEPDCVDESFVAYDAEMHRSDTYHGEHHLVDDELGEIVGGLRRKVGPKGLVMVVIDACHSNSMDRLEGEDTKENTYRGTSYIFGSEELSPRDIEELREKAYREDTEPISTDPVMSNVVYISACQSHERNYEIKVDGKGYGGLTYYFCRMVREKGLQDVGRLLTAIYEGMANDKSLKFHGQLPAIRNSIGWEAPTRTKEKAVIEEKYDEPESEGMTPEEMKKWGTVILGILIGFGLIGLLFWAIHRATKDK